MISYNPVGQNSVVQIDPSVTDTQDSLVSDFKLEFPNLNQISGGEEITMAFKYWKQSPFKGVNQQALASNVISLSFFKDGQELEVKDLEEPVKIQYNVDLRKRATPSLVPICQFWDFDLEDWSTLGCYLTNSELNSNILTVYCECNHLTDFALGEVIEEEFNLSKAQSKSYQLGITFSPLCPLSSHGFDDRWKHLG